MKWFTIAWIVGGAIMVSVAAYMPITQGLGPGTTTIISTMGCIGVPFLAFGLWGLYAELKPGREGPGSRG